MTLRTLDGLARSLALALGCSVAACSLERGAIDPAPLPAQGCASCHAEVVASVRRSRLHATSAEGCLLCHLPHAGDTGAKASPAPESPRIEQSEAEGRGPAGLRASCQDCHAAEAARFKMPFRHPLGNAFTCTSCHPPHGLAPRELVKHLRKDSCVDCHREYYGPFQYEHEGDRNLGCLSCHEPHGSPNRRLLNHADTRLLCFSCHNILDGEHIQNAGSIYRQCLACHTEVHGSNWDPELLK